MFSCQEGKESEFDEHVDGILSEPFFCTLFRCDLVYDISFRAVFFKPSSCEMETGRSEEVSRGQEREVEDSIVKGNERNSKSSRGLLVKGAEGRKEGRDLTQAFHTFFSPTDENTEEAQQHLLLHCN